MRVLVTGGAGFIGSHLVEALVRRGDDVVVLDDFSTGREERLASVASRLAVVRGDVRDEEAVRAAARGCEAAVHLAAVVSVPESVEDPARCMDVNVTGTARVLEACRRQGARRFVLASSCAVYGDSPACAEHERPRPRSPYAASKLAGEHLVEVAARLHGLGAIALRFFNVYGARQDPSAAYAAVVPRFAAALAANEAPAIFGDGEQTRDFVHVSDVVRAVLSALACGDGAWGEAFNVGTGRSASLNALEAELRAALARAGRPSSAPPARHEPPRAGDLRHSKADVARARTGLGFEAESSLAAGLDLTLSRES